MSPFASLLDGVAVRPLNDQTQIEVSGPDAVTFLHNFCTQDVKALPVGRGAETFFCDVRGKTIGHATLYRYEDGILIETVPNQGETLCAHLDRYLITEDVQLNDRSQEWANIAILGRGGPQFVLGSATHAATDVAKHEVMPDLRSLPLPDVDASALELRTTSAYQTPAFHLRCAADDCNAIVAHLVGQGAAELTEDNFNGIRIAAGWPEFGVDIASDNLPQEIDRNAQAISFDKGCYLGQETVARIDALGHVNWKLIGVTSSTPLEPGLKLLSGDKQAGTVRSCVTMSGDANPHSLGMALIRRELANAGERLSSDNGEVEIVNLPYADWLGEGATPV